MYTNKEVKNKVKYFFKYFRKYYKIKNTFLGKQPMYDKTYNACKYREKRKKQNGRKNILHLTCSNRKLHFSVVLQRFIELHFIIKQISKFYIIIFTKFLKYLPCNSNKNFVEDISIVCSFGFSILISLTFMFSCTDGSSTF